MVPLRFVIIVLLLVKPVYLLYECAFNGHLVSALSRGATSDDIHAIEIFGRTFSGLAFGMIVLRAKAQLLSDKGIHDINLWRALSIVLAVAIFVFFAQKALVNLAAAQSNAATRQAAQRIAVLFSAHNRSDRPLSVSGFAFDVGSNYEKTVFTALAGAALFFNKATQEFILDKKRLIATYVAYYSPDRDTLYKTYVQLQDKFETELFDGYRTANIRLREAHIAANTNAENAYQRLLAESQQSINQQHPYAARKEERYRLSTNEFYKLLQVYFQSRGDLSISRKYAKSSLYTFGRIIQPEEFCQGETCPGDWDFVNAKVSRLLHGDNSDAGSTPEDGPTATPREAIARGLAKAQGIDLPAHWHLEDKDVFLKYAESSLRKQANDVFADQIRRSPIGAALPPGLSMQKFEAHPAVQTYLRRLFKESFQSVPRDALSTRWDAATVNEKLFIPALQDSISAPADDFANGSRLARQGRDAVRLLLTPVISLTLSLFFGLFSIYGLVMLSLGQFNFRLRGITTHGLNVTIFLLIAVLPFLFTIGLAKYPGYKALSEASIPGYQQPFRYAVAWVVRIQPAILPISQRAAAILFQNEPLFGSAAYANLRRLDKLVIGWLPGGADMEPEH